MISSRACFFTLAVLAGAAPLATARAQTKGFALDRYDPAEHGGDWFAGESLDLRGHARPFAGLTLDWAHRPLVFYDADGDVAVKLVENQIYAHLGGGVRLWDRLRLALNLPILLVQTGESDTALDGLQDWSLPPNEVALGDLRLGADLRLLGSYRDAATLAIGLRAHVPTGDREAFTGDGKIRLTPRLMLAGEIAAFAYSAQLGFVYRAQDSGLGGVPTGSELEFVLTAGVRVLDQALLLGPELWGTTVVVHGGAFDKETTPFELALGGHYRAADWVFGLAIGPGLTRGLGAPTARVLLSLAWSPEIAREAPKVPEAPPDRDHDGVADPRDACPDVPGVPNADPSKNGCPSDRDGDRVIDADDACPDTPGVASSDREVNGCPPDRDDDGVIDADDACPDVAGERNADPAKNGCPRDRDGDTIIDAQDACPNDPGPADPDPQKNGCPKARVEQGQIKIIERIEFKTNSAVIVPESTPILEAVLAILKEHPEITRVLVEGHTDNVGKPAYNQKLSERRAASVVTWLAQHGVVRARLHSAGLGLTRPLESNDTEQGRERNRRVEFHIEGGPGEGGGVEEK